MTDDTVDTPAGRVPAGLYEYMVEERRQAIARVANLSRLLGMPGVKVDKPKKDAKDGRP